jgi:hypothetical protein
MQTSNFPYRRSPLPPEAKPKIGWIFLCLAALLGSPFLGFAIHGKVAEPGLVIGLAIATIPLAGLAALAFSYWLAIRRLPRDLAEEWRTGRVIPPVGAPAVAVPARFSNKKELIEIRTDGLLLSSKSLLGLRGVSDAMGKMWVSQAVGEFFVPWTDLSEWEVHTDSDGPDFYRLPLKTKGHILVGRFQPVEGSESDLLNAVRSVGGLPIRMRCDLDEPA